jgi:hypothetical protein
MRVPLSEELDSQMKLKQAIFALFTDEFPFLSVSSLKIGHLTDDKILYIFYIILIGFVLGNKARKLDKNGLATSKGEIS